MRRYYTLVLGYSIYGICIFLYIFLSRELLIDRLMHTCTVYVRVESETRHPKQTVLEKQNTGTALDVYVRVESETRHPKQTVLEKQNTGTALDVTQPATTCFDSDLTTWAAVYTPTAMAIIYLCIHVHAYTHASETEDL